MRSPSSFGNTHSVHAPGRRRRKWILAAFAWIVFPVVAGVADAAAEEGPPAASAAEFLPTHHAAWRDVELLSRLGGLPTLPLATRPLPRLDVARALADLLRERPRLADTAPARRLARELAPELVLLGKERGGTR